MDVLLEFKNYKLLKDEKFDLSGSNVYLVTGSNEKGKTSFISGLQTLLEAENKTKQPVTNGEVDGSITGTITMADGLKYIVKFNFTNDKDQFVLVYPDGKVSKKVSDIRALFQYNAFTADEFLSWSNNAEGRRKQKNIILGLLPTKVQEQYLKLELDEKDAFAKRTLANSSKEAFKVLVDKQTEPNAEYIQYIDKIDTLKASLVTLEDKYTSTYADTTFNNQLADIRRELNTQNNNLFELTKNDELGVKFESLIADIGKLYKEVEDRDTIKARIDKGKAIIEGINKAKSDIESNQKTKDEYEASKTLYATLDTKVSDIRKKKAQLILDAKLPLQDISIQEDGIYIQTPKGDLPFNDSQISTSRVMKLVAKIMLMINKTTPILCIGRAESFDKKSIDELAVFAKENGADIFLDKVIEEEQPLKVIGYEYKA